MGSRKKIGMAPWVCVFFLLAPGTLIAQRAPAIPLVTRDPYFSIWSRADRLTDRPTTHWTGAPEPLTLLVKIDGRARRLIGDQPAAVPAMPTESIEITPTRTIVNYRDGGVRIEVEFFEPNLPDDLSLLARPASEIDVTVFTDDAARSVAVYFDAGAELAVDDAGQSVRWSTLATEGGRTTFYFENPDGRPLERAGDDLRIDWGRFLLSAVDDDFRGAIVAAAAGRQAFIEGRTPEALPPRTAVVAAEHPAAAFWAEAKVQPGVPFGRRIILAYDDVVSIRYMDADLPGYWRTKGMSDAELVRTVARTHDDLHARALSFDREFADDMKKLGGENYRIIATLAYRQAIAGVKICRDAAGRPLVFPKENFSNGCIATVDVIYPMAPMFLLFGSDLAKAMLVPVLDYGSSARWKFPFAPHDLGTYPQATGQVYGGGERTETNQMPVEESANLILLVAAITQADGNAEFAAKYMPALTKWAIYLAEKGYDPENQLCTDDFAGHLAHNVNLSAKAILALGAFAEIANATGDATAWSYYAAEAKAAAERWLKDAADGDHLRLTFDKPGTWSQKYNLIWDRILELNLFPDAMKAREAAYYRKVQQAFGLPLDSRKDYTKFDWTIWSACLSGSRDDFDAIIAPLVRYIAETPTRVPLCDWYGTKDGRAINMIARPVVGGAFAKALHDRALWKKWFSRGPRSAAPWAPFPLAAEKVIAPTGEDAPVRWMYTFERPADGFEKPGFDARGWRAGDAPFGAPHTPGIAPRTEWTSDSIRARRTVDLPLIIDPSRLRLRVFYDEDIRVWINGVLAAEAKGYVTSYRRLTIAPEALATIHPGENTIVIGARNTSGGQGLDCGLVLVE